MIYSNGCSFSTSTNGDPYPAVIAKKLGSRLMLRGYPGFSNRAIIRCTVRDILRQKNISLVLIGLTFIARTEIWDDQRRLSIDDGHFVPLKVDDSFFDWGDNGYMSTTRNLIDHVDQSHRDYYRGWVSTRNDFADTTNVITDLVMLKGFLDSLGIEFRIFCNAEPLSDFSSTDSSYKILIDPIKEDTRFLWLFEDSFCLWAGQQGFVPYDRDKYGINGHPDYCAHQAFASKILETL